MGLAKYRNEASLRNDDEETIDPVIRDEKRHLRDARRSGVHSFIGQDMPEDVNPEVQDAFSATTDQAAAPETRDLSTEYRWFEGGYLVPQVM